MKKNLFLYICLIIVLSFSSLFSQELRTLRILHWNDFHSANIPFKVSKREVQELKDSVGIVGGSAYLKAYIDKYKDSNTLVLNAGDDFQGSPASTVTKGKSQIELLNLIKPDVMTLGNHEFDYSADTLFNFLKEANFKIINANLIDKETQKNLLDPYIILEKNGIKVAVIGIVTHELTSLTLKENLRNIVVKKEIPTIRKYIKEISNHEKPNLFVLLSHCGIEDDMVFADSIPQLNLIIGGHSHTKIKNGRKHNHTLICQAGEKGKYLGKLDLKVDISGDSIYSYDEVLIPTINSEIMRDSIVEKKVEEIENKSLAGLNEVIGELKNDWVRTYNEESNIGDWMSDVIKDCVNADIAFQNSGGIRKNLLAGKITIRDVWEIAPFSNTIVYFSISGESIKKLLEHQVNGTAEKLQVAGIKYQYDDSKPIGNRITDVKINGKELETKAIYKIATNNYVAAQANKYFGFDIDPKNVTDTSREGKDLFIESIKKQNTITSKLENRMQKVNK
jgi:5'-nucleotidase / UDP-sugar diphosphatase